ncbi:Maintenance of telomere capping protein 1 [Seiridium cupressi]
MASKKKAPIDDELGELFSGIGDDGNSKKPPKPKTTTSKARADMADDDILAELENLGDQPARPHTPRVKDAVKRSNTATPPPAANRLSEDKPNVPRKSGESTRSYHASFTPSATSSEFQENEKKGPVEQSVPASAAAAGGGWWGGIFATATATASAAIKQAEVAYTQIQQNEDAKKYLEQVKGNVGYIKSYGDELRHRALPTFAEILHTLAPPIASHERLLIHITHDLAGYPSLDPLIYGVFSRVMSQVEGGDLLVIQRGHESTARRASDAAFYTATSSSAGWRDGPWWRQVDVPRDLGTVKGLVEGTKLCRVSAESYANDYFASSGGVTEAQKRALEPLSEDNPVRTSDIFLAVQAITVEADSALFAGSATGEKEKEESLVVEDNTDTQVCFAIYVLDPVHDITYSTVSQSIPAKWIRWLDAPSPLTPASSESENQHGNELTHVPDEIREIVESGGVDPREWVAEWVVETLSLSAGVVAQRYVARRMGVGEGGLGKGKQKVDAVVQEGGGEAARAGLI